MFVVVVHILRPCTVKFYPLGAAAGLKLRRADELQLAAAMELGPTYEKELRRQNLTFKIKFWSCVLMSKI